MQELELVYVSDGEVGDRYQYMFKTRFGEYYMGYPYIDEIDFFGKKILTRLLWKLEEPDEGDFNENAEKVAQKIKQIVSQKQLGKIREMVSREEYPKGIDKENLIFRI